MDATGRGRGLAVRDVGVGGATRRDLTFSVAHQRWRRSDFLLAICFVVKDHIARSAPKMCSHCRKSHIGWDQLDGQVSKGDYGGGDATRNDHTIF